MAMPIENRRMVLMAVGRGESVASDPNGIEITERGPHKLIKACTQRGSLVPHKHRHVGPSSSRRTNAQRSGHHAQRHPRQTRRRGDESDGVPTIQAGRAD